MGKKVISFSLYGKHPMYSRGAVANLRHARRAYPGWVCRFYVADDVQEVIVSQLRAGGAEIINMGPRLGNEATFWRFFAAVDPDNEITIVRDTDSRFTKCELLMVNEWLASGKKFHVMVWGLRSPPIMAGLWGVRGAISNLREPLESHLRLGVRSRKDSDQIFLENKLYPQMKGDVFIHRMYPQKKRKYFIGETIHPFPAVAYMKRGKYLNISALPVGMRMPSQRVFIVFSIYKRTIFSEFLLTFWLGIIEKSKLFSRINVRFYVADNISPGLIERLRRHGQVIIKSTKAVRKDDPQYWKLLILSEKNLDVAVIVDFWEILFLVRAIQGQIRLYEVPPIRSTFRTSTRIKTRSYEMPSIRSILRISTRIKTRLIKVATLSVCGPAPPISDIENLIARRAPDQNYREFIRSTVYPRTSTTRMTSFLMSRGGVGFLYVLARILLPLWLYNKGRRFAEYLEMRIFPLKRQVQKLK